MEQLDNTQKLKCVLWNASVSERLYWSSGSEHCLPATVSLQKKDSLRLTGLRTIGLGIERFDNSRARARRLGRRRRRTLAQEIVVRHVSMCTNGSGMKTVDLLGMGYGSIMPSSS